MADENVSDVTRTRHAYVASVNMLSTSEFQRKCNVAQPSTKLGRCSFHVVVLQKECGETNHIVFCTCSVIVLFVNAVVW